MATTTTPRRRTGTRSSIFGRRKANDLLFWILTGLAALVSAGPLLWLLFTSLKPASEIYGWPPTYLPQNLTFGNYQRVLAEPTILRYIANSFIVSGSTTILILLSGGAAAYALSRLAFRGRNLLLVIFLAASMFPTMAVVPALFIIFRQLGLINTYAGIILAHTALFLPLGIWILATYFRTIPVEIEESAILDGCSPLRLMWSIIFPMSIPGLISAGLIVFMHSWNEFILALILLSENRMRTAVVGISLYPGEFAFPWETISVATILAIIPPLFIFLFFQRYIVGGLTAGAAKN